ncbi:zinc finger protein [Perkinsela sp. CCAP 1560/4]|nr:zinc finger protein [Perkinsela sp. CCAP 1560/4]|eukprot:KNH03942.1 zinc finger protein [Perkinsela sp. CCAP 1560/4]
MKPHDREDIQRELSFIRLNEEQVLTVATKVIDFELRTTGSGTEVLHCIFQQEQTEKLMFACCVLDAVLKLLTMQKSTDDIRIFRQHNIKLVTETLAKWQSKGYHPKVRALLVDLVWTWRTGGICSKEEWEIFCTTLFRGKVAERTIPEHTSADKAPESRENDNSSTVGRRPEEASNLSPYMRLRSGLFSLAKRRPFDSGQSAHQRIIVNGSVNEQRVRSYRSAWNSILLSIPFLSYSYCTEEAGTDKLWCSYCGQTFPTSSVVKKHEETHTYLLTPGKTVFRHYGPSIGEWTHHEPSSLHESGSFQPYLTDRPEFI